VGRGSGSSEKRDCRRHSTLALVVAVQKVVSKLAQVISSRSNGRLAQPGLECVADVLPSSRRHADADAAFLECFEAPGARQQEGLLCGYLPGGRGQLPALIHSAGEPKPAEIGTENRDFSVSVVNRQLGRLIQPVNRKTSNS
jgi:hypothetical protein